MATSVATPVAWVLPVAMLVSVLATLTPRPICIGLVPPVVAVEPEAALRVWLRRSLKLTRELL